MRQTFRRMCVCVFFLGSVAVLLGGCGAVPTKVVHDPLTKVAQSRQGKLLLRQLVDKRKAKMKPYIGHRRKLPENVQLEPLMTKYIAEAIRMAGYEVVIVKDGEVVGDCDAIIEGDIVRFWVASCVTVWHKVEIDLRAIDPAGGKILWSGKIKGGKTNPLWWGATPEFENVIRQAMTRTLNTTAKTVASDEFYGSLKKQ